MDQNSAREISALTPAETTPAKDIKLSEHQKPKTPESGLSELILRLEKFGETGIKQDIAKQSLQDAVSTIKREEGETDEEHTMNLFIARQGIIETSKLLKTTDFGLEDAKQILTQEYSTATGMDIDQIEEISRMRDLDEEMDPARDELGIHDIFSLLGKNTALNDENMINRIKSFENYYKLKDEIKKRQTQIMGDHQGVYNKFAEKIKSFFVKQGERIDNWTLSKGYLKFIGENNLSSNALATFSTVLISAGALGYVFNPQGSEANAQVDVDSYRGLLDESGFLNYDSTGTIEEGDSDQPELSIEKQSAEFIEYLRLFKSLGYQINVERSISGISTDKLGISEEIFGLNNSTKQDMSLNIGNPLETLKYRYEINKEIPIELSDNRIIRISPFQITSELSDENKGIYRVYDWLDPANPLIIEKKIPLEDIGEEARALKKILSDRVSRSIAIQNDPEEGVGLREGSVDFKPTYFLPQGESLEASQRENVTRFLENITNNNVSVNAIPEGEEVDRRLDVGPLSKGVELNISLRKLAENGFSPIYINGQIKEISFYQENIDQNIDNIEPAVQVYKDQHGNVISKYDIVYRSGQGNQASSAIKIMPSIEFAPDTTGPDYKALNIDLTKIGLGAIEGLFYVAVEKPIANMGNSDQYRVYSNIDTEQAISLYETKFPDIAEGISQAEKLFGFSEGKLTQNVYIINSEEQNAVFYRKDPETIAFWDEILNNSMDAKIIAAHETYHLIDYKFQLSSGGFLAQYEDIKSSNPWFFEAINEKNFLPEMQSGGHAEQNHLEFFASFLNTLNHPQLEQELKAQTPEFLSIYTKTLEVLSSSLKANESIPDNAPVHGLIGQKLSLLKSINKKI